MRNRFKRLLVANVFAPLFLTHFAGVSTASALTGTNIRNFEAIARVLDLRRGPSGDSNQTAKRGDDQPVKVAILDNGFAGWKTEVGVTLPASTIHHPGPVPVPQPEAFHGTAMAQIVTAVLTDGGRAQRIPFELHLFSAYGYTNLAAAVETLIRERFDVALYAQVWEYGGNGHGDGFINALVSRAANAGILWVNAAGNFARAMHRAPVLRTTDDWVALPGPNNSVRIRCHRAPTMDRTTERTTQGNDQSDAIDNSTKKCTLRLVLSWNDFKDDVDAGSDKDLDLVLTDDTLKIVQTAGLKQAASPPPGQPGYSKYPREILQVDVEPGLYYARVKVRSRDLFSNRDNLTLTSSGEQIEMLDHTLEDTLLNPADNPLVVTVGASDSERSSSDRARSKPDLSLPSLIQLNDGSSFKGSSNSSAMVAGLAALLKATQPNLTHQEFISAASRRLGSVSISPKSRGPFPAPTAEPRPTSREMNGRGLPLSMLGFGPTAPHCFALANTDAEIAGRWPHVAAVLRDGGKAVHTTAGVKIIVPGDPLNGIRGLLRRQPNDMIVANPTGFSIHPRVLQGRLPNTIEIVELPLGTRLCTH